MTPLSLSLSLAFSLLCSLARSLSRVRSPTLSLCLCFTHTSAVQVKHSGLQRIDVVSGGANEFDAISSSRCVAVCVAVCVAACCSVLQCVAHKESM